MNDGYELSERFSAMLKKARADAGKSQDNVAKKMGISKKTIQSWEDGSSYPNARRQHEFFRALDANPLPYYLQYVYSEFIIADSSDEEQITEQIIQMIKALPLDSKKKLLYWLRGDHGGSSMCSLEFWAEYLSLELPERTAVATLSHALYITGQTTGRLIESDYMKPNSELVELGIREATESIKNGNKTYSVI